jgi:hypothetical protein
MILLSSWTTRRLLPSMSSNRSWRKLRRKRWKVRRRKDSMVIKMRSRCKSNKEAHKTRKHMRNTLLDLG